MTLSTISGFPGDSVVKNLPANEGDEISISGSGRSPGKANDKPTPVYVLRKIPWTEEPGGLHSIGSQKS